MVVPAFTLGINQPDSLAETRPLEELEHLGLGRSREEQGLETRLLGAQEQQPGERSDHLGRLEDMELVEGQLLEQQRQLTGHVVRTSSGLLVVKLHDGVEDVGIGEGQAMVLQHPGEGIRTLKSLNFRRQRVEPRAVEHARPCLGASPGRQGQPGAAKLILDQLVGGEERQRSIVARVGEQRQQAGQTLAIAGHGGIEHHVNVVVAEGLISDELVLGEMPAAGQVRRQVRFGGHRGRVGQAEVDGQGVKVHDGLLSCFIFFD